jgi:16S rRNA (cytosine967-C5)-methyltransferase
MSPEKVREMAAAQGRILAAGAGALRPGGVLVYATCTISPTENERVIAAFLDSNPDFGIDDLAAELPACGTAASAVVGGEPCAQPAGTMLTLPHRDHTAGFFIARMSRS